LSAVGCSSYCGGANVVGSVFGAEFVVRAASSQFPQQKVTLAG